MSKEKTVFETLSEIDLSKMIKELQGSRYVPWADALNEAKKEYPGLKFGVFNNSEGLPYFSSSLGIFVKVWVEIEGEKQELFMPVLNSAHKALKEERYSYFVNEYSQGKRTGKMIEKFVDPATSFDVNTSIMRGLTKCLAVMGLGLYVYRDEVMPEEKTITSSQIQQITNLCKQHNYRIQTIADEFGGYGKIANIPESRFEEFMTWATPKEGGK